MARKTRSDITVGSLEKKLGVAPGTISNPNGKDARSDKKLGTLRKEFAASNKKKIKITEKKQLTTDQKSASKRKVKSNPKTSAALVKKVSAVLKKSKTK